MRYALVLHSDDGERFDVPVPDLPGCFVAGNSFNDAVESARSAIDAHCELLAERGAELPVPRPLAEQRRSPGLADAI